MDEIYLDYDPYDPRNAPPVVNQPGRPLWSVRPSAMQTKQPIGGRQPAVPAYHLRPQAPPLGAYYGAPMAPGYYPPGYYPPTTASKLGSKLSDLTVGDVVPLLAQLIIAFRPMPNPPADEGRMETNVLNLTKFVDAIGRHFHADQQLSAAGTVAGTFLR